MGNQCKLTLFEEKEEINIIKKAYSPFHTLKQIDDLKKSIMEFSLFERKRIAEIKYTEFKNKKRKKNLNPGEIKIEYIEINELLLLNNTDKDIVKLYLNFIKENNEFISKNKLIPYEKELSKFQKLFTKEEMNEIKKNYKKLSEKDNFLNYLRYLKNSTDSEIVCADAKKAEEYLYYFNYPIEFSNQELYYYKLYMLLILEITLTSKNNTAQECETYIKNRIKIAKMILEKNVLNIKKITENEDKMNILIILILFDNLDENNESINFNRLLHDKEVTITDLELFVEKNKIGELNHLKEKGKIYLDNILGREGNILSINLKTICLENLKNKSLSIKSSPYIYNTLDSLLIKNDLSIYIEYIKKFLIKIIHSNVYNEAIKELFKENWRYLIEKNIIDMENYIEKRVKFYPYQILNVSGLTDKLSCYSFIPSISSSITEDSIIIPSKISVAIENLLHEINHVNQDLLYFKGNNISLLYTPTRIGLKSGKEGGDNLEEILFGKKLTNIGILESLYILNEKNYEQTLIEFKNNFLNLYNFNISLDKKIREFLTIPKDGIFYNICGNFSSDFLKEGLYKKSLYSISAKEQINNLSNKFIYIKRGRCCLGNSY